MGSPDLILHNANVITLDGASRRARAIAVEGGRITAVGSDAAILNGASPATRRLDLAGRSVLPGFLDAHRHADREGMSQT